MNTTIVIYEDDFVCNVAKAMSIEDVELKDVVQHDSGAAYFATYNNIRYLIVDPSDDGFNLMKGMNHA